MRTINRKQAQAEEDGPLHITPEGFRRLKERLARLKQILPDLALEAQRTAAYGDRSENAEYKEAKSALRRTQRQIWTIEEQIKRAILIQSGQNASGTVQLGSTVMIESSKGVRATYEIVGSFETDPKRARISQESPLGAALIGRAKGDLIKIQVRAGPQEYRILEIQ